MARWYKIIPALFVMALAFALAFVRIDDPDVWWHLKCGELFLRDFHIPRTEIFSYTALGKPWVDGYLPAQVMLYLAWRVAGPAGVIILGATLVAGAYALALLMTRRNGAGLAVALAVSIPAVFLARSVMLPRPALLTPVFALLTLQLLEDHRLNGGRRIYWMLPLTALWANSHPGFPLGPVITGMYIVGAFRKKSLLKRLGVLLAGQLVATLINPYGYRIYYSTVSLLLNSQLRNAIIEWKPLYGTPAEGPGIIPCFIFVVASGMACLIRSGRRARIEHALLFILLAFSTVFGRRNLITFGPLSVALIGWIVGNVDDGSQQAAPLRWLGPREVIVKAGAVLIMAMGIFLIWFSATNRLYFYTDSSRATGLGIKRGMFPERAADLLERERVEGNIFHIYGLGGYLIFRLYPAYKVFIDGRIYPYPFYIYRLGNDALSSRNGFEILKARYNIKAVLLPVIDKSAWGVIYYLLHSPDWAVVQADESGALFLARGVGNDSIIKRYEMDLLKNPPDLYSPQAGRDFRWWNRAEYPYGPLNWMLFYQQFDRNDLALRALEPAMNYRPVNNEVEVRYADLLMQAGKVDEGLGILRRKLNENPDNILALIGLADYHIRRNELDDAEKILLRVARREPGLATAWNSLGEIAFSRRDYAAAADRFRRATALQPGEFQIWEKLGMSLESFNEPEAKDAYRRALEILQKTGVLTEDIKRVQERLNNIP